MNYVFIIDLEVKKANMLQNPSFITPSPVMACVLAMHALDKNMNGRLGIKGVGIIHRDCRPWVEYPINNNGYLEPNLVQRRGAYLFDAVNKPQATPLQPMALMDLKLSLLVCCDSDSEPEYVKKALLNMRLAGGDINPLALRIRRFESLDQAIHQVKTGYWVNDVTWLMSQNSVGLGGEQTLEKIDLSKNPAERLIQLIGNQKLTVPVNLGYSLLSKPMHRRGARDIKGIACDHTYAEHLIGLVQFVPVRQAKESNMINAKTMWRYGWVKDEFLVTNSPSIQMSEVKENHIQ